MALLEEIELAPRSMEKRRAIIDAAERLFLERGFGAVSMDAVAEEAKVSKRTVYSHFENKAALFSGVMMKTCTFMQHGVLSVSTTGSETATDICNGPIFTVENDKIVPSPFWEGLPNVVLMELGTRFLQLMVNPHALSLFRTVIAEAGRFPDLGAAFNENGPKPLVGLLTEYLTKQNHLGTLTVPDPTRAAWRFFISIKEPIHMEIMLGVSDTPSQAEIDTLVAVAVEEFLALYKPAR